MRGLAGLLAQGTLAAEAPIRHRDGHLRWVGGEHQRGHAHDCREDTGDTYVGTIRDVTAARSAAERERAVARLATAVSVARSVGEVLSIMLDECRDRARRCGRRGNHVADGGPRPDRPHAR